MMFREKTLYNLTDKEQTAFRALLRGTPITKAAQWLLSVHISSEKGEGWPHLTSQDMPTVWGGTLDGLRGVVLGGISLYHPIVQRSIQWLLSKQRDDGAFGSREILYSCVEATAWVIIALKQIGYDIKKSAQVQAAIGFLERSISENGEVGTSPEDPARTYPSVLTLWALHGLSKKTTLVARFLKDTRDSVSGGWGVRPNARPNPLSTSQVLNALLLSGHLDRDDVIVQQAIDFILAHQTEFGNWPNFTETWYSKHQPNIPIRCDEYVTTWAIMALLRAGLSVLSPPIVKGVTWLIHEQKKEGYWLYDPLDDSKHIWCVADSINCLVEVREKLMAYVADGGTEVWNPPLQHSGLSTEEIIWKHIGEAVLKVRQNLSSILVVIMALYVFRAQVNALINTIIGFLKLQSGELLTSLVSNALWIALVVVGTYILQRLKVN